MEGLFCNNDVAAGELNTAFGCLAVNDIEKFIAVILPLSITVAGGIAFILIVIGSFRLISSSGNPEAVKSAKNIISAGLSGLLLIIFSIFIYRYIGADILQLPGLV